MMDIDHFKKVNDSLGHQAGDRVIRSLSALIQRVSGRASDLPARVGGEEFCLLVCNETILWFTRNDYVLCRSYS